MAGHKRAGGMFWRRLKPLPLALFLALVIQALEYYGWLASPEGILLDFFLGKMPLLDLFHSGSPPAIATLEIDDPAFKQCFGNSPMDPSRIKPLVQAAREANPRVIGVDIIIDSEDPLYSAAYHELESLSGGKPPVVWAAGAIRSSVEEAKPPWEWFFGGEPTAVELTPVLGSERQLGR